MTALRKSNSIIIFRQSINLSVIGTFLHFADWYLRCGVPHFVLHPLLHYVCICIHRWKRYTHFMHPPNILVTVAIRQILWHSSIMHATCTCVCWSGYRYFSVIPVLRPNILHRNEWKHDFIKTTPQQYYVTTTVWLMKQ